MTTPAHHWREYLIEVAALGTFMVSAATMTALLEHPAVAGSRRGPQSR